MVIFLNLVFIKASTGGTHEAEQPPAHGQTQGLGVQWDELREISLTSGRHREHEPWVNVSNNPPFRGVL